MIAPEKADEVEGRLLEAQEARARRRTRLVLADDGEGLTHIRGAVPTLHGAMLRKALWALTDPASEGPRELARGQAFCDLLERIPRRGIAKQGGCTATVVVTMTLDQLRGGDEREQLRPAVPTALRGMPLDLAYDAIQVGLTEARQHAGSLTL